MFLIFLMDFDIILNPNENSEHSQRTSKKTFISVALSFVRFFVLPFCISNQQRSFNQGLFEYLCVKFKPEFLCTFW